MKNTRRGDDVPPVEVPATDAGFPVSTPPASAPDADHTTAADTTDGAAAVPGELAGAPVGAVEGVEGDAAPLMTLQLNFHREFRKHAVTGTIVAVELVNGALHGVRECSKPEEQTHGALPVLTLDDRDSAVGQWYRAEAMHFQPWSPLEPPKVLMDALMKLYEESLEARSIFESAKLRLKHAKSAVEDVDERVFHMLRRIHEVDGQLELPLKGNPEKDAGEPEPELPLEGDEE